MSELKLQIRRFIQELVLENCSQHTVRAYTADLKHFPQYAEAVAISDINLTHLRAWLTGLYDRELGAVSICRHIATLRRFFHFLKRDGLTLSNPAKLLRVPKIPHRLPDVPTVEQVGALIDHVEAMQQRKPIRDLAILEILYGCGLRISELASLNLEDIDRTEGWFLIRGKGRKERQVPYGGKAKEALERYLVFRQEYLLPRYRPGREARERRARLYRQARKTQALFLNQARKRLSDRAVRNVVKRYGVLVLGDSTIHPHSFRHAFASHLLQSGADLRSIQDLLGHASLSSTQIYTKVAIDDLKKVYDHAHPRGGD